MAPIDPRQLRDVLGHYPTGVAAATATRGDGRPEAMVVGTFTSVSLDPPLVAFLPRRSSSSFARLREASGFAVNVLAHDQERLCRRLARSDPNKLGSVRWTRSAGGHPVLEGAVAVVQCAPAAIHEAGDHFIVLGEVTEARVLRTTLPLLFYRGGYGGFAPGALVLSGGSDVPAALLGEVEAMRPSLQAAADRLGGELTVFARVQQDAVAVASATAGQDAALTPLGTRYPLVPPLGVPLVAWSEESDQEGWVDRALGATDQERAGLRAHLRDARRSGWSVALHDPEVIGDPAGAEAERSFAPPARQSPLVRRFMRAARYLEVAAIRSDAVYPVGAVMAPLRPGSRLMLRLLLFPSGRMRGEELMRTGQALVAYAAAAAAAAGAAGAAGVAGAYASAPLSHASAEA